MAANSPLDWILGGLALAIALGGIVMLFNGLREMNNKP